MAKRRHDQPGRAGLQWVRRPRTPVMFASKTSPQQLHVLQWVRRPRTPVMEEGVEGMPSAKGASMGPASKNAGYARSSSCYPSSHRGASMGPASKNAGYVAGDTEATGAEPASMGPASKNAGYASGPFPVISQRLEGAAARGCLHAASLCRSLTSGTFITPFLRMRWGVREGPPHKNRDNSKLSKNIAPN